MAIKSAGITAIVWAAICSSGFSQPVVTTFQKLKNLGIDFNALDEHYASPIHADTALALLKTKTEQDYFEKIYRDYLTRLSASLFTENFTWDKPFALFQKTYFNPDGTVAYFLYNLLGPKEERPDSSTMMLFEKSVAEYITRHPFPMHFSRPFGQCAPMIISPKKSPRK